MAVILLYIALHYVGKSFNAKRAYKWYAVTFVVSSV